MSQQHFARASHRSLRRRANQPGGTFFLTLVTERRAPIFAANDARARLRNAIEHRHKLHPFVLEAIVLMYDHLH